MQHAGIRLFLDMSLDFMIGMKFPAYLNIICCPVCCYRLEREKAEALCQQKEAMNRAFRVQLAKLMKEKEDLIRKCQTKNQLAPSSPTNSAATNTNPAELQKLVYELGVVRSEKKKTEDQLQV